LPGYAPIGDWRNGTIHTWQQGGSAIRLPVGNRPHTAAGGCMTTSPAPEVVFDAVSKFYGEVLGVNGVTLRIPPGITSLVGPNGSGKTTLMNLMAGLIHPDRGTITVRGLSPHDPESLMRVLGYATQYDSAPRGTTGTDFIATGLLLAGYSSAEAASITANVLARVGLTQAADRKIAGYSKGMRQRVRLAQALSRNADVLVLDEPLNGLDPLVRAETIAMFRELAAEGKHVILSSHVLQEVDIISDQVILIANGMIVAEGQIRSVREEIHEHPSQFLIRCRDTSRIASLLFEMEHVTQVKVNDDNLGLLVMTRNRREFSRALTRISLAGHTIESVVAADENVDALYEYLIGAGR
jgi:ABC-2 type transport system ATP-binding protein